MDEESLEAAIQSYNAQLQQVELALGAGLDPSQQSDLIQLQEDLKQLIELTESSLVSVRKSKLLATLDTNASSSSSPVGLLEQDTHPDSSAQDEEYAAFKEAIAELGTDEKPSANNSEISSKRDEETDDKSESKYSEEEVESDREEGEEELSGMKVKAPYYSSWGTLEYHNAMIVGTEDLEDGSAGVRVLYLYPTHKSLKPCPFFLDDKCRFKENCRFSHGQVVSVEELQPFQEPNLSTLEVGSACLAKHSDGIWYTAKITDIDSGYYTVKFDSLLLKEAVVEGDSVIPPLRSEDGAESAESDEDSVDDSGYAKVIDSRVPENGEWTPACSSSFGGWEAHTRGIGSKLLVQMGYEFGKGLGKNSEGRVEPVQAVVLPRGKSLDQCAEVLQKKKQGKLDPGKSRKCRAKGNSCGQSPAGSRKPSHNVFDFLNEKLRGKSTGEKAGGMAMPERNSKEIYHASKSTKKALSVHLFQTMEKIEQTQKDIRGIQQALARNIGRHSIATAQLEEKLANAHKQLGQLQAQEASLQREQKKADTHKKMTEF
ncbi:zinc finger CCCH-type with G patch domain-containing protein [Falco biarmicus]|uniref:zinc finger CCCH-type with G patch domain-containing protein n=1 Tax=Falco rusticolus TaxID=120794 RepID=UPI0018866EDB|nr:zinc finger CCCH-type with G patch domain-containing protein [Falco rusticolus]XP_040464932.1 zinc finger CCCH-type with G patch domain-containing protein [Falco naumanni]XP_056210348.1 zinc finger CCCH-type with G patch domain-containing protein [Falco biarmicus]